MEKPGAWSPVPCVSVRVRDEKRKQPRGRRSRCALKTVGHSGRCEGGVSPGGSSGGGHSSDLAAQVGPQSGACGQCGLGGGHCAASGGREWGLKTGSQAGQARRIWWDLPEELVTAGDQPQLIQGIRSGDGVGEDQETTA